MYITFHDLLEFEEMKDAKVLAGEAGLNHPIKWGHVIELKDSKDWATSNLLIFTTGMVIKDEVESGLINMIQNFSERNASGLVLGLGIITEIPQSVIDFANEKEFPFIAIPGEVRFADVTFKIGNQNFEKMSSISRQHILIENVITDTSSNNYEAELEYYGYLRNVDYCLVAVRKDGKGRIGNFVAEDLQFEVQKIRNKIHRKIFYYNKMNQLVFLIPDTKDTDSELGFESIIAEIDRFVKEKLGEETYCITISEWVNSPMRLPIAYKQVLTTFEKGRLLFPDKKIISYKDLGIFSMVDLNNTEELGCIMKMSIGDLYKNQELLETLQVYIDCNMNMQETADEMYVHVNTIKYRMKKIDRILPEGLEKNKLYQIQTGIYLSRVLGKMD